MGGPDPKPACVQYLNRQSATEVDQYSRGFVAGAAIDGSSAGGRASGGAAETAEVLPRHGLIKSGRWQHDGCYLGRGKPRLQLRILPAEALDRIAQPAGFRLRIKARAAAGIWAQAARMALGLSS